MKKLLALWLFSAIAFADTPIWINTDASFNGIKSSFTIAGTGTVLASTTAISGACTMSTAGVITCPAPAHTLCTGSAPAMAAGTGAGTTPTVPANTTGADSCGLISITTGTTPAGNATVLTVTFASTWGAKPFCRLTPGSGLTAALSGIGQVFVNDQTTTTGAFIITSGATGLVGSTAYKWYYACGSTS